MLTRREWLATIAIGAAVSWRNASIAASGQEKKKDEPKRETVTLVISGMT